MELKVKLLSGAKAPEKLRDSDIGFDLFAYEPFQFTYPLQYAMIRTGISITPPEGYYSRIVSRSSSMSKKDIIVIEGTVDSTYTGELMVQVLKIHWDGGGVHRIEKGEKIAQLILTRMPEKLVEIKIVDKLEETDRGEKGFGSSGGYKN